MNDQQEGFCKPVIAVETQITLKLNMRAARAVLAAVEHQASATYSTDPSHHIYQEIRNILYDELDKTP